MQHIVGGRPRMAGKPDQDQKSQYRKTVKKIADQPAAIKLLVTEAILDRDKLLRVMA